MSEEQMRNDFELKIAMEYDHPTNLERDGDGYADGYVDNAWWGWQAALNSQAKSVPVAPSEAVAKVIRHAMNQVTDYDHSDCRDHGFTQKTLLKAERYISSIIDTTPQPPQSIEADRVRELMEDCASDLEEAAKLFKAYPLMPQNHINAVVLLTRAEQLRKTIAAMKPEKGE